MESWTVEHLMGGLESPYRCEGAYVYRLASDQANNYFFINDNEAQQVTLKFRNYEYTSAVDLISGAELEMNAPIRLEAYSGRWLRFKK